MPASLIDQEDGVGAGGDDFGDLREVQVHRLAIAGRRRGRPLPSFGQTAPKIGRCGTLISRSAGTAATLRPPTGHIVWPIRASSANQISILSPSIAFSRAIASRRVGKFFKILDRTLGLGMVAWPSESLR